MKNFLFLAVGFGAQTDATMGDWEKWFETNGDKIVDKGAPTVSGREITKSGISELPLDDAAISGYMVVKAADMDEAVKLAEGSPINHALHIYETMTM